jgi:hypothetical protein
MRNLICIVILFNLLTVKPALCLSKATTEPFYLPPKEQVGQSYATVPDCAANSVYLLCQLFKINVSYGRCLDLLPIKQDGNSALEVKEALNKLGISVRSVRLLSVDLAKINNPLVLWDPPAKMPLSKDQSTIGHFSVVRPLGQRLYQAIDFPNEPMTFTLDQWTKYLNDEGIKELVVLECVLPQQPAAPKIGAATQSSSKKVADDDDGPIDGTIVIDDKTRVSLIQQVKKGDLPEGTLLWIALRNKW